MDVVSTAIEDVKILTPRRFGDGRGFFSESWSARAMQAAGLEFDFVQDNESLSREVGTLRGLHYQAPPFAQAKLVRVVRGAILDVAVDVRTGSPDYGKWTSAEITAENGTQILVPRGFLHGFVTLVPDTHVIYKADGFYNVDSDGAVIWNDPTLAVDWKVAPDAVRLSEKDGVAPLFSAWKSPFTYRAAL
jgi:dTDP-4-dehydrorhamnose 3,5-epimerase